MDFLLLSPIKDVFLDLKANASVILGDRYTQLRNGGGLMPAESIYHMLPVYNF